MLRNFKYIWSESLPFVDKTSGLKEQVKRYISQQI